MQLCSASGPALRLAGGAFLVHRAHGIRILRYAYLQIGVSRYPFAGFYEKKDQGPSVLTATQQRSRMRRNVTGSLRRQWRRAFRG